MPKRKLGCVTRKGKTWYFVMTGPDGRRIWRNLHTEDEATARKRSSAELSAAGVADDRAEWLRELADRGRWAAEELARSAPDASAEGVGWDGLYAAWKARAARLTEHRPTLANYERALRMLAAWAVDAGAGRPAALTPRQAREWAQHRQTQGACAGREITLFSRVWRETGLRQIWDGVAIRGTGGLGHRRLTTEEVRRLVRSLRQGSGADAADKRGEDGRYLKGRVAARPDVADLVALSWHTGMRRGDAQRIRADNVEPGGQFLRFVPQKTRGRKPQPLIVPLIPEGRELVARLCAAAGPDGLLFPRLADAWLNKRLREAFARAKISDDETGTASFHSLRTSYITAMDEAGVPPHICDAITGHAKQGMHGRYSRPGNEAKMAAALKAVRPLGL